MLTETQRQYQRKHQYKLRQKRIAEGRCERCGGERNGSAFKMCDGCRTVRAESYRTLHREKRKIAHKIAHQKLKLEVFEAYGGSKCQCCGEHHVEFLSIDHIAGGGRAHRREVFGVENEGGNLYAWLKRQGYPEGYRVLCMNCNCAYGHHGYCPHSRIS